MMWQEAVNADVSLYGPYLLHVEPTLSNSEGYIAGPFSDSNRERLDSDLTDGHDDMMDCVHEPWHDSWCFISSPLWVTSHYYSQIDDYQVCKRTLLKPILDFLSPNCDWWSIEQFINFCSIKFVSWKTVTTHIYASNSYQIHKDNRNF